MFFSSNLSGCKSMEQSDDSIIRFAELKRKLDSFKTKWKREMAATKRSASKVGMMDGCGGGGKGEGFGHVSMTSVNRYFLLKLKNKFNKLKSSKNDEEAAKGNQTTESLLLFDDEHILYTSELSSTPINSASCCHNKSDLTLMQTSYSSSSVSFSSSVDDNCICATTHKADKRSSCAAIDLKQKKKKNKLRKRINLLRRFNCSFSDDIILVEKASNKIANDISIEREKIDTNIKRKRKMKKSEDVDESGNLRRIEKRSKRQQRMTRISNSRFLNRPTNEYLLNNDNYLTQFDSSYNNIKSDNFNYMGQLKVWYVWMRARLFYIYSVFVESNQKTERNSVFLIVIEFLLSHFNFIIIIIFQKKEEKNLISFFCCFKNKPVLM